MDGEWMDIKRAAAALNTTVEGLRKRLARDRNLRLGKYRTQQGNDKRLLVWITPAMRQPQETYSPEVPPDIPPDVRTDLPETPWAVLERFEQRHQAEIERLQADRERERADHQAERDRLRDDVDRTRQEADRWREAVEKEQQQVRALTDRLDRLHREHREHRATLEQARYPWWRRWWHRRA
jgi:hypothetical protein